MHVSLDGFVAGPNGEMNWICVNDELWTHSEELTSEADTALFGRVTYDMMEGYWPGAAAQPTATKHDIDHAKWVNAATKILFSRTRKKTSWNNSRIVSDHIAEEISGLKKQNGKNLLMIGSTSLAHEFMRLGLIDEFNLFVNPVVLGSGMPLFKNGESRFNLKLSKAITLKSGVVRLVYEYASGKI